MGEGGGFGGLAEYDLTGSRGIGLLLPGVISRVPGALPDGIFPRRDARGTCILYLKVSLTWGIFWETRNFPLVDCRSCKRSGSALGKDLLSEGFFISLIAPVRLSTLSAQTL